MPEAVPPSETLADRAIAPYFRDSSLWPVMLVVYAHALLGVGLALLDALRNGGHFSIAVLIAVASGTAFAFVKDLRRRCFGLTSRTLLSVWILGAAVAWATERSGIY